MNTDRTNCDKYKDYITHQNIRIPGDQGDFHTIYRFPNGYGASVIYAIFSQGLELAVLYFDGDTPHISTSTPITTDVVANIKDEAELEKLLDQIKELKGA